MWHSLVDSVESIADDLTAFEQKAMAIGDDRMRVSLPDWYAIESHRKIDETLTRAIGPLERYFAKIVEKFEPVTLDKNERYGWKSESITNDFGRNESEKCRNFTYVDYCSSVDKLNRYKEVANDITESLDSFDIGRLDQSQAIKRLTDKIADMRKIVVDDMLIRHVRYNEEICQDFYDLREKLLDVPNNAVELFKLSEMIGHKSMSLLLQGFESRVSRSIEMLISLLTVTSEMTESHMTLNATTIKWLADIKPLVARSNTLCEAMKSELEDDLQKRIVQLNLEIESVVPKFEILDAMDDATRVDEYAEHIRVLIGQLTELDRQIETINNEERLFKFPETIFPIVEEIRDILMPVNSLNNLAREWRRDHSVWLNGPFEYIDAAEVRRKTIHHYRHTFESLSADLKAKIKNDAQSSSSGSGSTINTKRIKLLNGIVDDPDPMQQPAPLTLSSRLIEEVGQFEGHLELIDCVCNPSLRDRHWREISIIYEQSRKIDDGYPSSSSSSSSIIGYDNKRPESLVPKEPLVTAPDAGTTLAKLISLDLAKNIDEYRVISIGANKELALANRLDEMIAKWESIDFGITVNTSGPMPITTFLRLDEIETLMEEHEVVTGEMRVSYFVKPIASNLAKFSRSLGNVRSIVKTWLSVQTDWADLEPVFRRRTTNEHLARARRLFFDINENAIEDVKKRIIEKPKFRAIVKDSSKLSQLLSDAERNLEIVRETVENYVQRVRNLFPRFYFISDREVIDIIFESEYSRKMRLLVRKCFTDMRNVRCSSPVYPNDNYDNDNRVTSIIDSCDREFTLTRQIETNPDLSIPKDCSSLVRSFVITERAITRTVRDSIIECSRGFYRPNMSNEKEPAKEKASLILTNCPIEIAGVCGYRLYWTSEMERALDHAEARQARTIIADLEAEQSSMIDAMLTELRGEKLSRKRYRTLVLFIIEVREQRDIARLMMSKVTRKGGRVARDDFIWKAKIRHYWRDNDLKVGILDSEECYGYEYSVCGEKEPVVRTPLTERCYHSLMEAHRNRFYGLTFGPGATGKTRTIESLARTLGVDLRIFDCGQGHLDDYRYMNNVLNGLVAHSTSPGSSSCWLLFKNLDLITIRGLSVLAQRVTTISRMIENNCFVTGTISSQRGSSPFRSRNSLPDTLKVLFRPIALAFPDVTRIVEVLLFAEGFSTASFLADKLRLFEKYSRSSLPRWLTIICEHENFGVRIVKPVVKMACDLKRRYPNETEDALLLRALVDVHLPKFTRPTDLAEFQHLMDDLFPNIALPPPNYRHLLEAIRRVKGEITLPINDRDSLFTLKIIQLYEMLLARHAVVVVGPSLAGKSTVIDTLARGLSLLNCDLPIIDSVIIHHDSFTSEELFGNFGKECSGGSGQLGWKDGIFTRALRSFATTDYCEEETRKKKWHWLVLDGPLDTPFVDKLTTLLDENDKTLFLRSGEKIPIADSTSVILETSSTVKATPATISRCGILYLEESSTFSWKLRTRRWIVEHQRDYCDLVPRSELSTERRESQEQKLNDDGDEYAIFLQSLLEWSLGSCLEFLHRNALNRRDRLTVSENHMIISVLRLLEMYLSDALGRGEENNTVKNLEEDERVKSYVNNFFSWSQAALLMSIVWGLGGSLDLNARIALDEFCKSLWRVNGKFTHDVISLPSEGLIRDNIYAFTVGASGNGGWRHWSDVLKRENTSGDVIDYFWSSKAGPNSYVPTIDSIRYISLFRTHVQYRKPFLVTGETATGKTLYMRHLLRTKMAPEGYQSSFHSIATDHSLPIASSKTVQNMFLSRMKKIGKGVYGPSEEARVFVNFIDDMSSTNASKEETILRELIRQYYEDSRGEESRWYDTDNDQRIRLNDVIFLGAMDSSVNRNRSSQDDPQIGGWHETARFFRHFNIYTIDRPSDESLFRIYHNVLLANFRTNMFNPDVAGIVTNIVNATIRVYSSIVRRLRPIPGKLQYHFGIRDASRLIDGCSLIHKESAETRVTLLRLWVHETIRVFADRVVDPKDADWLFHEIRESATTNFKDSWETVFDNLPKITTKDGTTERLTRESFRHLVFSDFMRIPDVPMDTEGTRVNANDGNIANDNAARQQQQQQQQRYEEITCSREALRNRAILYLERYNERKVRKIGILMFPEMLEHLMRICRVLDIPGGNLLMICLGPSSGRRSLTALAAHVKSQRFEELSCEVIQSIMTPNSLTSGTWRRDFKRACMSCVSETTNDRSTVGTNSRIRDCTFFISDREIIGSPSCPSILGDVRSLVKTGRATGSDFFTSEERDGIVERCRLLAQRGDRNREINSHEVMDYFYNKCQDKLHFVLYFDRSGMTRGRKIGQGNFTKILNQCNVDCYENWPKDAIYEIGNKFLRDVAVESRVKSGVVVASKYFWDSVVIAQGEGTSDYRSARHTGLPVSAYIHMVKLYGLSINKRQNETRATRERYVSGLDKLRLADEEVRKMRSTLTRLRPELELSAEETAETMRKIERENVSVEMATIQVRQEEQVANGIAEVAGILKGECEADLAVAIPILEDAIAALNTLKPTDITLVKAMKNPPDTVKLVLAAVCVMLGVAPDRSIDPVTGKKSTDYWAPSKRILGDMNFLQNLKDYDKDNIPGTVMSVVKKSYMNDESFMPHIVAKASSAAEGLCKWVRAMVSYDEVAKVVAPKKAKLATAERECNASLEYLNEKRTSLAALNDRLAALNASLQATLAKKLELETEVASCTGKLKRAEALIANLAGEKARWLDTAQTLTRTCDNLAGDVLLSCGLVALLSSFGANQRYLHINDWRKELDRLAIPNSGESYEFLGSLRTSEHRYPRTSPATLEDTYDHRNPHQRLSVNSPFNRENTRILEHSLLWPLVLDPQNQGSMWIKRVESSNGLVVVKPTNPRWFTVIRDCVEKNLPVLLENLDRDEYLERTPSILRYVVTFSPSASFRLYMTSRISFNEASSSRRLVEPHDMYKGFIVVNFTLSNDALEDRLLEIIVSREKPELRDTFDRLMIASSANRRLLDQEEEKILEVLSGTRVNIIEDERATETLDRWKNLSLEMKTREAETARATEREMTELRKIYRPLTKYCAALYDTLASLVSFNHMYRFSLDWFVRLYVKSIDTSMRSVVLDKRLSYLGSSFTLILDASVRNALLDEHKLLYSFLLSIKILLDTGKMNRTELRSLILKDGSERYREEDYRLDSDTNWIILAQQLGNALPEVFSDLSLSFHRDASIWEAYRNGKNDESLPFPWNNRLTDFQRLILVNRLKPEKTLVEVSRLVENTLGSNSIGTSSTTRASDNAISRSFEESSCVVPLIFVLPSYLEPLGVIEKWARTIGYSSRIVRFTMPPSTTREYSKIESSIKMAIKCGGWIVLENCHLASDEWLAKLEEISESLDKSNTSETALSFRLWLTSYPSTNFPISILHDGTKIYCEEPSDSVKQSLLHFYSTEPLDDPDFYNTRGGGNNARVFSKLVYAMCFFHAIVTGRNKFNELAWNVPSYEFTDTDFKITIERLRKVFLVDKNNDPLIIDDNRESNEDKRFEDNLIDTLVYLVGECYYGGRILDPTDRRCLNVILREFCNVKLVRSTTSYVFDNSSSLYLKDSREYSVPNRSEYRDFVRHVNNSLPNGKTPPRLFGLSDNATTVRDYENSNYFVRSLARGLSFIDDDASTSLGDRDPPRSLDIVRDIRSKLSTKDKNDAADSLDIARVKSDYPIVYEEPLNSLLTEEVEFYNKTLELIESSLDDVEEKPYDRDNEVVDSLTRNKIPKDWMIMIVDRIDKNLSSFVISLTNRREFLKNWTKNGHYRGGIWLGGLLICRKFILATRLTFARKSHIPLHRLVIDYEITNISTFDLEPWKFLPVTGDDVSRIIHTHGLYLAGARWDRERSSLVETLPKLYWNPMPVIRFRSRSLDPHRSSTIVQGTNLYSCPVNSSPFVKKTSNGYFLGSLSINYVTTIPLDSKDTAPEYWIKRATVLFCNK